MKPKTGQSLIIRVDNLDLLSGAMILDSQFFLVILRMHSWLSRCVYEWSLVHMQGNTFIVTAL